MEMLHAEGRLKTQENYLTAMSSFKKFKSAFGFYDISPEFLKKYEKWMLSLGKTKTTLDLINIILQVLIVLLTFHNTLARSRFQ